MYTDESASNGFAFNLNRNFINQNAAITDTAFATVAQTSCVCKTKEISDNEKQYVRIMSLM